jgi:AsmA protein
MKKLKIALWALAALVLVFISVCVTLVFAVDPNQYKDRIAATVERSVHRPLKVTGNMGWTFFPWLGIELGAVEMGNPAGFGDQPFAKIESAVLRVSLLSLLKGRIEAGTMGLDGLTLNLLKRADGQDNWSDLFATASPAPEAGGDTVPKQKTRDIALRAIDVRQARVVWDDQQKGQRWVLTGGEAHVAGFAPGSEATVSVKADAVDANARSATVAYQGKIKIAPEFASVQFIANELKAELKLQDRAVNGATTSCYFSGVWDINAKKAVFPELTWNFESTPGKIKYRLGGGLVADVTAEFEKGLYSFDRLRGDMRLYGESLPGFGLPLEITADAAFRASDQTAVLYGMKLQLSEATITGDTKFSFSDTRPHVTGDFSLVPFNLRKSLLEWGFVAPNTQDEHTFSSVAAQATIHWKPGQFEARGLRIDVDKSKLVGEAQWTYVPNPALHFNLALNGMDWDLYRPSANTAAATPNATPPAATALPLSSWVVNGLFKCGGCKASGLLVRDLDVAVESDRPGHVMLHPKALLYDGSMASHIDIDFAANPAELDIESQLNGVDVGALLTDFRGSAPITGHGDVVLEAAGQGLTWASLAPTLTGRGHATLQDGAVKGFNIAYEVRKARAKLRNEALPAADKSRATDFAELTTDFQIAEGVVKHSSITGKSPLMRVTGVGDAHMLKQTLDYALDVVFVNTLKGQGGLELGDLAGVTVPLAIEGSFGDPKVKVDVKRLAKAALESEAAAPVLDRAKEKVQEKTQDLKKKLDNKLKDLFR